MSKPIRKDALGWGITLWLFSCMLGVILFPLVPLSTIGWMIMPICTLLILWVLTNRVRRCSLPHYLFFAAIWTLIAVVFDYFFFVKVLMSTDGYYKPDVSLYYLLTLATLVIFGLYYHRGRHRPRARWSRSIHWF